MSEVGESPSNWSADSPPKVGPPRDIPIETNLLRKGFVRLGRGDGAIDTVDHLGVCRASGALRLLDVEVFGWLSGQLRHDQRFVEFSRSRLARDLYRRPPGGADRAEIAASLDRLATTTLTFGGFDAVERRWAHASAFENVRLLRDIVPASMTRGGQALTWRAEFEPWILNQLGLGYVTFVDWKICRSLRGLAKRLWLYACAENQRTKRRPEHASSFIVLSPKGNASLGLAYGKEKHASEALREAIAIIEDTDPRFTFALQPHGRYLRLTIQRIRDVAVDRPHAWDGIDPSKSWVGSIRRPSRKPPVAALEDTPAPADEASSDAHFADTHPEGDAAEPVTVLRLDEASSAELIGTLAVVRSAGVNILHVVGCHNLADAVAHAATGEVIVADHESSLIDWWEGQRLPWPRPCVVCRPRPLQYYWP